MKKIILIILLLTIFSTLLAEFDLSDANEFYQNQEYEKAKDCYENLIKKGVKNFTLFYNLGNTYFQLEKNGFSRLYYEKAAKIKPLDADLIDNLNLLKYKLKDKEVGTEPSFMSNIFKNIFYFFPTNTLAIFVLIFFILIIISTIFLIILRSNISKKVFKILIIIFSILFLIFLILTIFRIQQFQQENTAVIISGSVFAYSGPSKDFQQVFTIHEGLKVQIEKYDKNWVLIKLKSGSGGWIEKKNLVLI